MMSPTFGSFQAYKQKTPSSQSLDVNALSQKDKKLYKKAQEFEASFLSQMLQQAKIGMSESDRNGLVGQNFNSFLSKAFADQIVDQSGIGLSQSIFESLKAHS